MFFDTSQDTVTKAKINTLKNKTSQTNSAHQIHEPQTVPLQTPVLCGNCFSPRECERHYNSQKHTQTHTHGKINGSAFLSCQHTHTVFTL